MGMDIEWHIVDRDSLEEYKETAFEALSKRYGDVSTDEDGEELWFTCREYSDDTLKRIKALKKKLKVKHEWNVFAYFAEHDPDVDITI